MAIHKFFIFVLIRGLIKSELDGANLHKNLDLQARHYKNINSSLIFFFFQGAQANGVRSLGTNYRQPLARRSQLLVIIVYLAPQRKSHQKLFAPSPPR
ncbi:MAG: hypothetical protein IJ693_12295 [Bacteroidaceae bacterium]|nr:hypothetical protein [Bacteroidaceae bacterium]MBR1669038.1 hypothetical protein [Bacteroidaceae bacterium]